MDVRTSDFFDWDAVPGAANYDAEMSTLAGAVEKLLAVTAPSVNVGDLCSGPPALALGQTRNVRVRARDASNRLGDWSAFLTFTLIGLPAPLNLRVR